MRWLQNYSAVGHSLSISAMVAGLPIFFLFWALAYKRMKGYLAASLTLLVMLLVGRYCLWNAGPSSGIRGPTRNGKWRLADWMDHSHCGLLL